MNHRVIIQSRTTSKRLPGKSLLPICGIPITILCAKRLKKKTFISTGMSDKKNIEDAVNIFKKNNCPYELMHCVSTYPMANEDANLMRIQSLKKNFNCDVGYSGHEVGLTISYAASAMGITSLERHITLTRSMYGSDQAASVEPQGFVKLVNGVRAVSEAIGSGDIRFNPKELDIAKKLRAHLK